MLAVIETHPVQYHAPVYRALEQDFDVPVTAIYASDFSIAGSVDPEFNARVSWDVDLRAGHSQRFLSRMPDGGARNVSEVTTRGLPQALRETAPRAILLLGYSPRFHQLAFLAARRIGCPLLFRGETTDHARDRGRAARWLRDTALRAFYRSFSRLLFVGERSREHFRRLGIADERLVFSPYCVDTSPFDAAEDRRAALRDAARKELELAPHERVLLFSGKLSERKGVMTLMQALKHIPAPERPAIVFLGDGVLASALRSAAQEEPRVEARFPGFRNQSQLSPYYHAADALVLPSLRHETWGLVVNEALHHGVPCIASDAVGCVPDLIAPGVTGQTFAAGSAAQLAEAIRSCLRRAGEIDVRSACRARVAPYSIRSAAEGMARAYREAVSQRERA
jgi:glycosyltransferase involved in cell wall biosynthesis